MEIGIFVHYWIPINTWQLFQIFVQLLIRAVLFYYLPNYFYNSRIHRDIN